MDMLERKRKECKVALSLAKNGWQMESFDSDEAHTVIYLHDPFVSEEQGLFTVYDTAIEGLKELNLTIEDICFGVYESFDKFLKAKASTRQTLLDQLGMLCGAYMARTETFKQESDDKALQRHFFIFMCRNSSGKKQTLRPVMLFSEESHISPHKVIHICNNCIDRDMKLHPEYFDPCQVVSIN